MAMDSWHYKTFWERFTAGFIDGIIFLPLSFLDSLVFGETRPVILMAVWSVFSFFLYSAYSIYCHGRWGQTIGKKVMGVIVLDASEKLLPTYTQALIRDSFYVVASAVPFSVFLYLLFTEGYSLAVRVSWVDEAVLWISMTWFAVEVVTMLTNTKRRALHDWMARTVVIRL